MISDQQAFETVDRKHWLEILVANHFEPSIKLLFVLDDFPVTSTSVYERSMLIVIYDEQFIFDHCENKSKNLDPKRVPQARRTVLFFLDYPSSFKK